MNFKTTLVLLVLVAAGAALYYLSERGAAPFAPPPPEPQSPTGNALGNLTPAALTRIEIRRGGHTTVLARDGGVWSMPGKWPTRAAEADALAELLGRLRSPF